MKYYAAFLLLAAIASPCLSINTVPSLNITRYLGRWYQMYADIAVVSTFEKDGVCGTADYTLRKDGKIGVLNSQRIKTPTGELKQITGYVYAPDAKEPGKFKLHFDVVPVDGNYWIVKLGPQTFGSDNQYQYSIVTDKFQIMLYVLARDPEGFRKAYDEEVKEFLSNNGFTHFYNKPIATMQSKDCKYVPDNGNWYQTAEEYLKNAL